MSRQAAGSVLVALALVGALAVVDYLTGFDLGFFVFYVIPVSVAAWGAGRVWGMVVASSSAAIWGLVDWTSGHDYSSPVYYVWNAFIRLVTFMLLALMLDEIHRRLRLEREVKRELTQALSEVKALRGLLPICASCKKVRDDEGYWQVIEKYIADRTEAEFTHGLCPDCIARLYPQLKPASSDPPTGVPSPGCDCQGR